MLVDFFRSFSSTKTEFEVNISWDKYDRHLDNLILEGQMNIFGENTVVSMVEDR